MKAAKRIGVLVGCLVTLFVTAVLLGGQRKEYRPDYTLSVLNGKLPTVSGLPNRTYYKFEVEKDWRAVADSVRTELAGQKPKWAMTRPRGQDQSFKFYDPRTGHWTEAECVTLYRHFQNPNVTVVTLYSPESKPTKIQAFLQECRKRMERVFGSRER